LFNRCELELANLMLTKPFHRSTEATIDSTVIMLRGSNGVGKSTVAEVLKRQGRLGAVLEVDDFRHMIANVNWSCRLQHSIALRSAAVAAASIVSAGVGPVMLVDCFGRDMANATSQFFDSAGVVWRVVTLWAEPSVLTARGHMRGDSERELTMAQVLNEEVRMRALGQFLNTTGLNPEEVANLIFECLDVP